MVTLVHQTFNLKVPGSSLVSAAVFNQLDKTLYSTLSFSTQVYKWVPATIRETQQNVGVTL